MITAILFDFDGTLADSLSVTFSVCNQILRERGKPEITIDEGDGFRSLSLRELIKRLHLHAFQLPRLLIRMRAEMRQHADDIQPMQGIASVLQELKERGLRLGLVTSNSEENVTQFLRRCNMEFFAFGSYGAGLQSKAKNIRRLMRQEHLDAGATIYIGDTVQDIEASRSAGIRVAAVTWGYASAPLLNAAGPDWLISRPEAICEILA